MEPNFEWTKFYIQFADKLLKYKNKRTELLELIKGTYDSLEMKYPFVENGVEMNDVCPFTVFGCFNKSANIEKRIALIRSFAERMGVTAKVPTIFDGIPILNPMMAWFFASQTKRKPDDIQNLWNGFEAAIQYADFPSEQSKAVFCTFFDKIRNQTCIKWNITMGLYWIRPQIYLNLDERNRTYLLEESNPLAAKISNISKLKQLPSAEQYLELIAVCNDSFQQPKSLFSSFPQLSWKAWESSNILPPSPVTGGGKPEEVGYWIYAPGEDSYKWDEFFKLGIMGIEWDDMGDLKSYPTKAAMKVKMKALYGKEFSYINDALATWQFANELKTGDIVYVKRGRYKIIGRGVVASAYVFDASRNDFQQTRKVNWTHNGEWEHPGQAAMKTLTDITVYTDYVQKLEALFFDLAEPPKPQPVNPPYTEDDFLSEVFLEEESYQTLVTLLKQKKNIILQGAPGVGKTFAAKRLAYSVMGERDASRVMMVQFHQSYSYEDFIMGYRPTKDGFELTNGPFYEFCKTAQDDDERDYFFIIDEINRGNLSKIFGELLMLIEKDKRGETLRLLYSNELFSVPKNIFIIGMMNTADRSLAMIDYALRRRFAFFELAPAFDSDGFKTTMEQNATPTFWALTGQIKALNEFISKEEALGDGFRIGHSYLCTDCEITEEWLRNVVTYELLPLLNEYWFDEKEKVELWTKKLYGVLHD